MKFIYEKQLTDAFVRFLAKLQAGRETVLEPFIDSLRGLDDNERRKQIADLEEKLQKNERHLSNLIELMNAGYLEPDAFHREKQLLIIKEDELMEEKQSIIMSIAGDFKHLEAAEQLRKAVARRKPFMEFSPELFEELVETVTILSRGLVVFNLKCGLRLEERLVAE